MLSMTLSLPFIKKNLVIEANLFDYSHINLYNFLGAPKCSLLKNGNVVSLRLSLTIVCL